MLWFIDRFNNETRVSVDRGPDFPEFTLNTDVSLSFQTNAPVIINLADASHG